jgi:transcription elongation factor GreB
VSRAFTKEDGAELPFVVPRSPLPDGVPNYVTPSGLAALRLERAELEASRPPVGADDPVAASALAGHSARLAALDARLASAVLVEPTTLPPDEVRFSATVTLRNERGSERRYRIVGVDEADPERGLLAFIAPLARALSGQRVGDSVPLRGERGGEELEIVRIEYAQSG